MRRIKIGKSKKSTKKPSVDAIIQFCMDYYYSFDDDNVLHAYGSFKYDGNLDYKDYTEIKKHICKINNIDYNKLAGAFIATFKFV